MLFLANSSGFAQNEKYLMIGCTKSEKKIESPESLPCKDESDDLLLLRSTIHVFEISMLVNFQRYLLKPNQELFSEVENSIKTLRTGLDEDFRCISMHIRRGDKWKETPALSIERYSGGIVNLQASNPGT